MSSLTLAKVLKRQLCSLLWVVADFPDFCLFTLLQICEQYCVCHSDSNLCISAEVSLEDVISVEEVHLPTSVDSAQGYCTRGCAIFFSKKPANENKWIKGLMSHGFPIAFVSFMEC